MSMYGHYTKQYFGYDKDFPKESFKIKGDLDNRVKLKMICKHFNTTMPTLNKFIKKYDLKNFK